MKLIAILVGLVGILLSAYFAGYILFVGGIVEIVNGIKAAPVSAHGIAFGILRVTIASGAFSLLFGGSVILTMVLWPESSYTKFKRYERKVR